MRPSYIPSLPSASSRLLLLAVSLLAVALSACGGSDAGTDVVVPLPTTARVRIAQVSHMAALAAYKGLANDISGVSYPEFDWNPTPAPVTGIVIGGVRMPELTQWGSTQYVDIPAGTHTVSFLPTNLNPDAQKFVFAPGATVTFVRGDWAELPWLAYFESASTPIPANQVEIGVLQLEISSTQTGYRNADVFLLSETGAVIATQDLMSVGAADKLNSKRIAAAPFRVVARDRATGARLFYSSLITLKGGQRWNGKLFLREVGDSTRAVSFYSDQSTDAVTAIDDRASLRIVNLSSRTVAASVTSGSPPTGSFAAFEYLLPPEGTVTNFGNAGADSAVLLRRTDVSAGPFQKVSLPRMISGRAYDVAVTDGGANGDIKALVFPQPWVVFAATANTGAAGTYRFSRILNDVLPPVALQINVRPRPSLGPSNFPNPIDYRPASVLAGQVATASMFGSRGVDFFFPIESAQVFDVASGIELPVKTLQTLILTPSSAALPDEGAALSVRFFQGFTPAVNGIIDGPPSALRIRAAIP